MNAYSSVNFKALSATWYLGTNPPTITLFNCQILTVKLQLSKVALRIHSFIPILPIRPIATFGNIENMLYKELSRSE